MLEDLFARDDKLVLILGDLGVYTARNLFRDYPDRVFNIGICEQATVSLAAGLAKEGFRPIFYSIAPFAVERCLEQIKVDVGYQQQPVTIVSVGASYDYAALGCTHHCPADVELMTSIPNMRVYIPGSEEEMDTWFREMYGYQPLYMRLSERGHGLDLGLQYPSWDTVRDGDDGLIIVIGNIADRVLEAYDELGLSVEAAYVTELSSDMGVIIENYDRTVIVEPFYEGTTVRLLDIEGDVCSIGVPRRFLSEYGSPEEHDNATYLSKEHIKTQLKLYFNG
jgi:transketolase